MRIRQSKEINSMLKDSIDYLSVGALKTIDYISTHNHKDPITGETLGELPRGVLACQPRQLRKNFKELEYAGLINKAVFSRTDKTYYISTTPDLMRELESTHSIIDIPDSILNKITGKVAYMIVRALYIHAHINAGTSKQNHTDMRYLFKDVYGVSMPDSTAAYTEFYTRLKRTEETTGIQITVKRNGINPTARTVYFTFPVEYVDTSKKQREYNQATYDRLETKLEAHDVQAAKEFTAKVKQDSVPLRQEQPADIQQEEPLPARIQNSPVLKAQYDSMMGLGYMTRAEIIEQLTR